MAKARKYSVKEIDQMRDAINAHISITSIAVSFKSSERDAQVENELRTYMLNGTDPKELMDRADDACVRLREFRDKFPEPEPAELEPTQ